MSKVSIKPLSVNKCWQGRRFKTPLYKTWEESLLYTLPPKIDTLENELEIYLEFGFSTKTSDIDNPVKPFLDVLQKKYGFNDRQVYKLVVEKKIVKKGEEYIKFDIK